MDTLFRIRHYTQKVLLSVLGPADRGDRSEPLVELDRAWEERFGHRSDSSVPTDGADAPVAVQGR